MDHILMGCGVAAGPFFILVFVFEGMFRTGYQPLRQPVSALAMGPRGWIQRANFFVTGGLALVYVLPLRTTVEIYRGAFWAPLCIGIFGLGLIGSGVYNTDVSGLATHRPQIQQRTRGGQLHDLFAVPVMGGLFAACVIFGNLFYRASEWGWAWYSVLSGTLFLFLFLLAGVGFGGRTNVTCFAGLLQRAAIVIGWSWLSLSAAHLRTMI